MKPTSDGPKVYGINRLRETWVVREETARSMRGNKSAGTKPETVLRKALWAAGLRGYRKNDRRLPGKPDVYVPGAGLCVFVHGCFWHGCERCGGYRVPATNSEFWLAKVQRNRVRHAAVVAELEAAGVVCVTVWECEIKRSLNQVVDSLMSSIVAAREGGGGSPRRRWRRKGVANGRTRGRGSEPS